MYFIRREDIGLDLGHGGREMMSGFTSRKATSTNQTNTGQRQHDGREMMVPQPLAILWQLGNPRLNNNNACGFNL